MLWVLPLEILEERYTEQWYRWFKDAFEKAGIEYQHIDGETLTSKVENGVVLDAAGTNYWKFTQMAQVCRLFKEGKVKNDDKFLTMDLWHPSLEAIPYMAQIFNLSVEVYGFLHAGSYTTEDFAEPMSPWATYFEKGWAKICQGIFVGTYYHKDKFLRKRFMRPDDKVFNIFRDVPLPDYKEIEKKIHVTGNPFNSTEFYSQCTPQQKRGKTIIYPHRFDIEKRPNVFMDLMGQLWKKRQDFKVVFTTSREKFRSNQPWLIDHLLSSKFTYEIREGLTKKEYYSALAEAKIFVSTTIEENFGYCLLEAMGAGCIPVVFNAYSHPELLRLDKKFLVRSTEDMLELIDRYLDEEVNPPTNYIKFYDDSIERMIKVMYDR